VACNAIRPVAVTTFNSFMRYRVAPARSVISCT